MDGRLRGTEFRDHIGRNRGPADLFGVILAARRPDAGFRALDRKLTVNREAVLDVKTGAAELAHPRGHLDGVAELHRLEEIGARVDQWNAHDAEGAGELMRLYAERCLEHFPGVGVEDLEEAAVEHDAGWIALAPFDGQLPAVSERRHAGCLSSDDPLLYSGQCLTCHARVRPVPSASSLSSFSSDPATRPHPATAFPRGTHGGGCATHAAARPACAARCRGRPAASQDPRVRSPSSSAGSARARMAWKTTASISSRPADNIRGRRSSRARARCGRSDRASAGWRGW